MKKLFKEFAEFINKGNALALAIGVILGSAFTGIVTAINQKVISPLIGLAVGDFDLSESLILPLSYGVDENGNEIVTNAIYFGELIQAVIDFLLIAVILFTIFKIVSYIRNSAKRAAEMLHEEIHGREEEVVVESTPEPEPEPKPSEEVLLLTEIRDLLKKEKE